MQVNRRPTGWGEIALAAALLAWAPAARGDVFKRLGHEPGPSGVQGQVDGPRPKSGAVFEVDAPALAALLAGAPGWDPAAGLGAGALRLGLPGPDGGLVDCLVAESPVMEPELAGKYPQMRTYLVRTEDGAAAGRVELTPRGLTGMLRSPAGVWMIDPWQSADPGHVVSYWLRDLPGSADWSCHTTEGMHGPGTSEDGGLAQTRGPDPTQVLRTVRLAMACSGEWGLHQCDVQGHAPNVADPLAAIVTVVARTNVVYEADLGVHFNLVANNDQVVFVDPATDPYPTTCDGTGGADCSSGYLSVNISTLSSVIGNANFDLGHVLTRVYGGVAYLNALCASTKGGGVSGIPRGGDVDPFTALVVIHEVGHQFGATHTFSGTRGRCAGNVTLSSAWEAGSGSSPMAYPGGCPVGDAPPSDNITLFADPYFHHGSLGQMQARLAVVTCPAQSVTTNHLPQITSVPASTNIPPSTPFVLTATATDSDGETLTYSWEQFDSGAARPLSGTGSEDTGVGALFRVFPPVTTTQRTFPRMADVLSGVPTPGERLPTVANATRRFRVLVRDNHAGVGATATSAFVDLTIPGGTTPFAVSSPTPGQTLHAGSRSVAWSVGGTDLPPISCATVTLRLSLDAGATFPVVLGTFPNTGLATVVLPSSTADARIRVDADGEVFFAMSPAFTLLPGCPSDLDDGSGNGVPDGGVDINDLLYFLARYEAGHAAADLDDGSGSGVPDGGVDINDLLFFLARYEAGC